MLANSPKRRTDTSRRRWISIPGRPKPTKASDCSGPACHVSDWSNSNQRGHSDLRRPRLAPTAHTLDGSLPTQQAKPARLSAPTGSKPSTPGSRSDDIKPCRFAAPNPHDQHVADRSHQRGGRFHVSTPGKVGPTTKHDATTTRTFITLTSATQNGPLRMTRPSPGPLTRPQERCLCRRPLQMMKRVPTLPQARRRGKPTIAPTAGPLGRQTIRD